MKAGRLQLLAHSVELLHLGSEAQQPGPQLTLIAEVGGFGRLKTGERAAERGGEGAPWVCSLEDQELSFDLGPSGGVLKVVVYEARGGRDSFVAEGSLNMEVRLVVGCRCGLRAVLHPKLLPPDSLSLRPARSTSRSAGSRRGCVCRWWATTGGTWATPPSAPASSTAGPPARAEVCHTYKPCDELAAFLS